MKSSARVTFVVALVCLVGTKLAAGQIVPEPKKAVAAVDRTTAIQRAAAFANRIGLPGPLNAADLESASSESIQTPWGQTLWEIRFGTRFRLKVDATTADVVFFENAERYYEQFHRIGRTGRMFFNNKTSIQQYAWNIGRAIGLPPGAYLARTELVPDFTPGQTDSSGTGRLTIVFSVKPHGHEFIDRAAGMRLIVDLQDGAPLLFDAHWNDITLDESTVKITPGEAVKHAQVAYRTHYKNRPPLASATWSKPGDTKLGYVVPNGLFGSHAGVTAPSFPFHARLGWKVAFGREAVFIDAADGSTLGGILLK